MNSYLVAYNVLVDGRLRSTADATITVAEKLPVDDPSRYGEAVSILAQQLRRDPHPGLSFPQSRTFIDILSVTELPQ